MFTQVAIDKLNTMMKYADFVGVKSVTADKIVLSFQDKECALDIFGKVIWEDK